MYSVGSRITLSVSDFIDLAPRGLIVSGYSNCLSFRHGTYLFERDELMGGWSYFGPPTRPLPSNINGLNLFLEDYGHGDWESIQLTVIQAPNLSAIRRP